MTAPTRRTAPAATGRAPVTRAAPARQAPPSQPAPQPARRSVPTAIARSTVTQKNQQTGETVVLRDDEARSEVPDLQTVPHVGRITVNGGVTVNMGNFEFIRADVHIEMPCLPTDEGFAEAHEYARRKVGEFIAEDVAAAKERMAGL